MTTHTATQPCAADTALDFTGGVPFVATGLGLDQTWFGGSRLGVSLARHGGIVDILFYGRQPVPRHALFKADGLAAFLKLFRLCVAIDGIAYYPEFNDTRLFLTGYASTCRLAGVHLAHDLILTDETIIQRVRILAKPAAAVVSARLVTHGNPTLVRREGREWSAWEEVPAERALLISAKDALAGWEPGETVVAVSADRPFTTRSFQDGFKLQAETAPFADQASFVVCFGWDRAEVLGRIERMRGSASTLLDARRQREAERRAERPAFELPSPVVSSMLQNVPDMIDALRVDGIPGGMRACASHYWIWNWDAMIAAKSLMFTGERTFVEDMLAFYQAHADAEHGIFFCLDAHLRRFAGVKTMSWPTQCFYNIMLYAHFCATRDATVLRRHYPFARMIIDRCLEREVRDTGLIEGIAHFPDHPQYAGQDFHDLSAIANSVYYQGLVVTRDLSRALAGLDGDAGLAAHAELLDRKARACREGFQKHLFDAGRGYFVDSVSSISLAKRHHYPAHAILWLTPFAADLVAGLEEPVAAFMAANLLGQQGVYPFPLADPAFGADGNQYAAYYPPMEGFVRNLMSLTGRGAELEGWCAEVEWFWRRHTFPEALTFDAANLAATPDCVGGKQAFTGKPWLELFYTAFAGLDLDIAGLRLRPTPVSFPIAIRNIHVGDARLDLSISGKGSRIAVTLDGAPLLQPGPIPLASLGGGRHAVTVRRYD